LVNNRKKFFIEFLRRIFLGSVAGAVGATAVYPIDLGMKISSNKFNLLDFYSKNSYAKSTKYKYCW